MKKNFELWYWCSMVIVMSLVFMTIMGSFVFSFFLSVMLLPGILFVKYTVRDISFTNRKQGILHTFYLVSIALIIEYLAIIIVYWNLYYFDIPVNAGILENPFFIWFILAAILSIEYFLKSRLFSEGEKERFITFFSGRKKISLELDTISYIESRDPEVFVITTGQMSYPTRMKISQWDSVLDDRFIRVHRSFIVNRAQITNFDSKSVSIGTTHIEISRKYRESVLSKLRPKS